MKRSRRAGGFTLVEVLMVLVIVSILMVLAMPAFNVLKAHAQNVVCLGNLRGLHSSLNGCIQDNDMIWPQLPEAIQSDEAVSKWWKDTLTPYGMTERYMTCPADQKRVQLRRKPGDPWETSYHITTFDEIPNTAFRWKQPWAMEKWDNHGGDRGPNILMPDGAVQRGVALFK